MRKTLLLTALLLLIFPLALALPAAAAGQAECINACSAARQNGRSRPELLAGSGYTLCTLSPGTEITLTSEREIGGLYLEFSVSPGSWTLQWEGGERECGENGFLHEYISDLSGHELTLCFSSKGSLSDVFLLSRGERPDWVQDWQPCWDRADVLLLPTHSDDDQLYFAGVVPWCLARGARVQVAYLISHTDHLERLHELLDGLWSCGLRHYPVLGEYDDLGFTTDNHLQRYAREQGLGWEDFIRRQVELYRRFRPQVVITHAADGEYGHGAHKLYSQIALEAIELSGDPFAFGVSAQRYGVWTPPKVYVHNYPENTILLDLDSPLPSRDGMSPFQLAQEAFRLHQTQFNYFSTWLYASDTAAGIASYNPAEYGLYFSAVGADSSADSFFDNLTLYDEQERWAAEDERDSRAEQERKAQEEREQEAQEAREREEAQLAARLLELRLRQRRIAAAVTALSVLAAAALCWLITERIRSKER